MKRILALLLVLALVPMVSVTGEAVAEDCIVRVRLSTDGASKVTVGVTGNYSIGNTEFSGGTITATFRDDTITVTHSKHGKIASDPDSVRLVRSESDYDEAYLTLDNVSHGECIYLGDLEFYNASGTMRLVNHVPMHEYLYGAVSGEVSESSHAELLKTQTICAKGFALAEVEDRTDSYFDVYDTTTSQIYVGYVKTDTRTIAAVDSVWENTLRINGRTVKTYYCTANGGQKITPRIRWGGSSNAAAYHFGYDPFDLKGSSKNVTVTVNGSDPDTLQEKLYDWFLDRATDAVSGTAKELLSIDSLYGVYDADNPDGTDRYPSALAPAELCYATVTVSRTSGSNATATFDFTMEELVENGCIDADGSTRFIVRTGEREWKLIYGNASGHRAGLSHRGAKIMAAEGYSYVDILKFYFRGADLIDANGRAIESTADFAFTYEEGATGSTTPTPTPTATSTSGPTPTPTPTPDPSSDTEGYLIVIEDDLNLRTGAGTSYESMDKLPLGTIVEKVSDGGTWTQVRHEDTVGYVYTKHVSYYELAPRLSWLGVCDSDGVNFRTGPSTNFNSTGKVDTNTELGIYYRSGDWYYVERYDLQEHGWMSADYVRLREAYQPTYEAGDVTGDGKVTATDAAMLLRSIVGMTELNDAQRAAADPTGNGIIDAADAAWILRFIVGV